METEIANNKLSKEQIENWRRVLLTMIGPYALIAPESQIQWFRDMMQARVNDLPACQQK